MLKTLDPKWVELMKEARQMGFTPEEIRRFLKDRNLEEAPTEKTVNPIS